jgi:hypothetical protein
VFSLQGNQNLPWVTLVRGTAFVPKPAPVFAGSYLMRRHKAQHIARLKLDRLFRDAADALVQTKAWRRQRHIAPV